MNEIFFLQLSQKNSGLCNQLYSLASAICYSIKDSKNIIVINNFIKCIHTDYYCPISEVINIEKMNDFLKTYNIILIDYNTTNLYKNNSYNVVNDWSIKDNQNYSYIFNNILKNIIFSDKIYNIFNVALYKFKNIISEKINVIHLRLEDDSIQHWSKMNKMEPIFFKNKVINKYIDIISNYIDKNIFTLVLTADKNNEVINFLTNNNFNFKTTEKYFNDERELNAIIDFLLSKLCNSIFIGPGNSTFTQFIMKNINSYINITFDLDNIDNGHILENKLFDNTISKLEITIPNNFNIEDYKKSNNNLKSLNEEQILIHYLNNNTNNEYKNDIDNNIDNNIDNVEIPNDFNVKNYKKSNSDLHALNEEQLLTHYLNHGIKEGRKYNIDENDCNKIPNDFNVKNYKRLNTDLHKFNEEQLLTHYLNHGIKEGRKYKYDKYEKPNYFI